jgi:hypothetical protein
MQQLWRSNECKPRIGDELCRYFVSADIDLFFSKYRSVFDNIAQLIKTISRGSLPSSFHELMKKAKTGKLSLGMEYVQLILKCNWFETLKNFRDSIEHDAAETNVDYNRERVLFMISSLDAGYTQLPGKDLIDIPEIRENNFSNFELFAGIYIGYLIWFLEELSKLITKDLGFNLSSTDRCLHPGYRTIRTWIQCGCSSGLVFLEYLVFSLSFCEFSF